jgi:lipopolysaccharide export LptBFGC system permease protein LptF
MSEGQNDAAQARELASQKRYHWPWVVLAAVLLAVALAILWVRHEVKRIERSRDLNAAPPGSLK